MGDSAKKAPKKNPLFGAAVVKAVLRKRGGVSDDDVEAYLAEHAEEVEQAIRSHGRRGD